MCICNGTYPTLREALLKASIPGKVNTPVQCMSCGQWGIKTKDA